MIILFVLRDTAVHQYSYPSRLQTFNFSYVKEATNDGHGKRQDKDKAKPAGDSLHNALMSSEDLPQAALGCGGAKIQDCAQQGKK